MKKDLKILWLLISGRLFIPNTLPTYPFPIQTKFRSTTNSFISLTTFSKISYKIWRRKESKLSLFCRVFVEEVLSVSILHSKTKFNIRVSVVDNDKKENQQSTVHWIIYAHIELVLVGYTLKTGFNVSGLCEIVKARNFHYGFLMNAKVYGKYLNNSFGPFGCSKLIVVTILAFLSFIAINEFFHLQNRPEPYEE